MAVIEAIATCYLEADAASITFSGIPDTYQHLQIRGSARSPHRDSGVTNLVWMAGNGSIDTGANWNYHISGAQNTTGKTDSSINSTYGITLLYTLPGLVWSTSIPFGFYGVSICNIMDYASVNKNKTFQTMGHGFLNAYPSMMIGSGMWDNKTDPIDIIKISANTDDLGRSSEFTLYGWNSS